MKKESMSRIERRKAQQRKKTPVQWKKSTTLFSSALIVSSVGTPVALLPVTAEATEEATNKCGSCPSTYYGNWLSRDTNNRNYARNYGTTDNGFVNNDWIDNWIIKRNTNNTKYRATNSWFNYTCGIRNDWFFSSRNRASSSFNNRVEAAPAVYQMMK